MKNLGDGLKHRDPMDCASCGFDIEDGQPMTEYEGKYYHSHCFYDNFQECSDCGEVKSVNGGWSNSDSEWICSDCIKKSEDAKEAEFQFNRVPDDREYRMYLYHFLQCHFDEDREISYRMRPAYLNITNIEVAEFDDRIVMRVFSHRPGLLIGRAGADADDMKEYINRNMKEVEKKIKIEFRECPVFKNMYGY